MAEESNNGLFMWIFTIMIIIGFILIYRNLNSQLVSGNKYEGLIVAAIGLVCSVFLGIKSASNGIESFGELYGF